VTKIRHRPVNAVPSPADAVEPGRWPFFLLLFLLAFAPLAFGTVEHWSKTIAQLTVAVALIWCIADFWRAGEPLLRVPGLLPLLLLVCLPLLQLVPLPIPLLHALSPHAWEAYRPVSEAAGGLGWLYVIPGGYPFLYSYAHESWLYYLEGGNPDARWFHDSTNPAHGDNGWFRLPE